VIGVNSSLTPSSVYRPELYRLRHFLLPYVFLLVITNLEPLQHTSYIHSVKGADSAGEATEGETSVYHRTALFAADRKRLFWIWNKVSDLAGFETRIFREGWVSNSAGLLGRNGPWEWSFLD
jgi:hypothetical protein